MDKLVIEGGHPLNGRIKVSGSKNAALPILFAAILSAKKVNLGNVPRLRDILTTLQLLQTLGLKTDFENNIAKITPDVLSHEAPYELVRTMRASILCLGPLLAKTGFAKVALPGGCAIGARPVDQHLKGMEKLGAKFRLEEGYVIGECKQLVGDKITFDMPTVGGTENLLMAACCAKGHTTLENAAREPEVIDLANFLNFLGAKITGHGTSVINIEGVNELKPQSDDVQYDIMPDRIECATYIIAAAITGGALELENCPVHTLDAVIAKLQEMDVNIEIISKDRINVSSSGNLKSANVKTLPYPGFPTDMQAQIMALNAVAKGVSVIEERIFENRFMHVQELVRMGANIQVNGRSATIRGVKNFIGAPVMASDLRASASLVLAGLGARGVTEISRIYHLDRGYEKIEEKLNSVGAKISRISEKS